MRIHVSFYSYFRDLTDCSETTEEVPDGTTLESLLDRVRQRYPKLEPMRRSTLAAVGVDYQDRHYLLKDNDAVSLFPPVQGG